MAEKIVCIKNLINQAKKLFVDHFHEESETAVYAPGRVNIIGEHTDYNDGFVLPMALPLVTVIVGKKIPGNECTVVTGASLDNKDTAKFDVKSPQIGDPHWSNYVKGVVANYKGHEPPAFLAAIASSVPIGGGLSSSAALEVSTYLFLDSISDPRDVSLAEKALACQKAEHDYAKMPCGIMDQFISIYGKKNYAVLLDCRDLSTTLIPMENPDIVWLITNSNKKHALSESQYPVRRKQCEDAAIALKKDSLRNCVMDDIQVLEQMGVDPVTIKRAKHVISEIHRTQEAAKLLKAGKFEKVGQLMNESHVSLKDDFEVSSEELDQLVDLALEIEGVLGSRMTGGGFGGCTISMVRAEAVDELIKHISKNYKYKPTFYICTPWDGAGRLY